MERDQELHDKFESYESQLNTQLDVMNSILSPEVVRERAKTYEIEKWLTDKSMLKQAQAVHIILSDGKAYTSDESFALHEVIEENFRLISEQVARNFVQNRIEQEVEKALMEKQDKYIDEMRLSILKKEKGPENSKTQKRYEELLALDEISLSRSINAMLRPESMEEIIGQDEAINSLLSKIASPYPQHIILYGPPGVGKTTAARIALQEAKKLGYTPYGEAAKFVEVDGTTLRWDPREIANPLLGSVHDPIYQGSKRDLAESGIPEPKPGLVTEAHGGILFIDEIGELDTILQNKLLKVLEDKRVEFSSSYYDPDDENVPNYIRYLFEKGAPADFTLIGATTREPEEISPALKSRATAVFFEPLSPENIETIVENAAKKLNVTMEEGVLPLISGHSIEGRKAVNILSDAYSLAVYRKGEAKDITITKSLVEEILGTARIFPVKKLEHLDEKEVGRIYGLAVSGFIGSVLEIEAAAYEASEKGKGTIRFNDTAGSMAKDSVFNAASAIRKLTGKDIKNFDLHINVVGGANIDGPSAGAAITCAILSAMEGKPLHQDIAMTGEIALSGKMKPVGGIREKIDGARRRGITQVIVPKDNLAEVPKNLKGIQVVTCENLEEAYELMTSEEKFEEKADREA